MAALDEYNAILTELHKAWKNDPERQAKSGEYADQAIEAFKKHNPDWDEEEILRQASIRRALINETKD